MNWLLFLILLLPVSTRASRVNGQPLLNPKHVTTMNEDSAKKAKKTYAVKCGKRFLDRSGRKYGRLTAIRVSHYNERKQAYWLCVCDCGTEKSIFGGNLTSGAVISCGCYSRENPAHLIHGAAKDFQHYPEYDIWLGMKGRVHNPNNKRFKFYGGRGITICQQWLDSFENFYRDMGQRPHPKLTLHRVNNNGNYCPENCVWATKKVQNREKTNTHWQTYQGERKSLADWADITGINYTALHQRLRAGWSVERAFTTPVKQKYV